jgi:putative NADPH-quinone reductase
MRWLPPHILHAARRIDEETVSAHVARYRELLAAWPHWPAEVLAGEE